MGMNHIMVCKRRCTWNSANFSTAKSFQIALILSLLAIWQVSHAAEQVFVQGHFDQTRLPTAHTEHFLFAVTFTENGCKLCVTNRDDPRVWETVTYDGTNTYILTVMVDQFRESKGKSVKLGGILNPGRLYYMLNRSLVDGFVPWITYCLPPNEITASTPFPTVPWRENIASYGWRWEAIRDSADKRFLQSFSIVRDKSLDLDDKKEFLRPTYEYATTIDIAADDNMQLAARKQIPDGFVGRSYVCNEWFITNGYNIPKKAEMDVYLNQGLKSLHLLATVICADSISISDDHSEIQAPIIEQKAYVRDYRYTKRDDVRMFPYAEYKGSGQWKSGNDSELLAQQDYYMKHGQKIGEAGLVSWRGNGRLISIWLLLLVVNVAAIAMLVKSKMAKNKTKGIK